MRGFVLIIITPINYFKTIIPYCNTLGCNQLSFFKLPIKAMLCRIYFIRLIFLVKKKCYSKIFCIEQFHREMFFTVYFQHYNLVTCF